MYQIFSDYSKRRQNASVAFIITRDKTLFRAKTTRVSAELPSWAGELCGCIFALDTIPDGGNVCVHVDIDNVKAYLKKLRQFYYNGLYQQYLDSRQCLGKLEWQYNKRQDRSELYRICHRVARAAALDGKKSERVHSQLQLAVAYFFSSPAFWHNGCHSTLNRS